MTDIHRHGPSVHLLGHGVHLQLAAALGILLLENWIGALQVRLTLYWKKRPLVAPLLGFAGFVKRWLVAGDGHAAARAMHFNRLFLPKLFELVLLCAHRLRPLLVCLLNIRLQRVWCLQRVRWPRQIRIITVQVVGSLCLLFLLICRPRRLYDIVKLLQKDLVDVLVMAAAAVLRRFYRSVQIRALIQDLDDGLQTQMSMVTIHVFYLQQSRMD